MIYDAGFPRNNTQNVQDACKYAWSSWVSILVIYIYGHNFVKTRNNTEAILRDTQSGDSFLVVACFDLI